MMVSDERSESQMRAAVKERPRMRYGGRRVREVPGDRRAVGVPLGSV